MGHFRELLRSILTNLKKTSVRIVEYELCTLNKLMVHESSKLNTYSFVLHEAGHEQKMTTRHGLEEILLIRPGLQVSKRSNCRL